MIHEYDKEDKWARYTYQYTNYSNFTDYRITFEIDMKDRKGKLIEYEVRNVIDTNYKEYLV